MAKSHVVMRSIEDLSGQRCVDLIRARADGCWAYVECRRDPEDAFGWRRLTEPVGRFDSEAAARAAAVAAIGWMREGQI